MCVLSYSKLRAKLGLKPLDVRGSKAVPEVSLKAEGEAREPGEITGEGEFTVCINMYVHTAPELCLGIDGNIITVQRSSKAIRIHASCTLQITCNLILACSWCISHS